MKPLHYVIFHPENAREKLHVSGGTVIGGDLVDWSGTIWVDKENGNEDPYVLTGPWLYSYYHATQLRRDDSTAGCVFSESVLFFAVAMLPINTYWNVTLFL